MRNPEPLSKTHPELAKQAFGWNPDAFVAGSAKKVMWKCNLGHIWEQAIRGRIRIDSKGLCPVCNNKIVLAGFNDLATTNPEILSQVDGWDPTLLTSGSVKKVRWKCSLGHNWEATVHSRARVGRGCPYCAHVLLLKGFNDLKTNYPEIAAEADGWDPSGVITGSKSRKKWKCIQGHTWETTVNARTSRQTKCNYCNGRLVVSGENDLRTTHPELTLQANGWDPSTVVAGSRKIVSWKCDLGHIWETTVESRARLGRGCGYCSGNRVLKGFNDLETLYPAIAREAYGWDPSTLTAGSEKRVSWICAAGHKWKTDPKHRVIGRGCPSCASHGFNPSKDGWLYFLSHEEWELFQIGITNEP